MKRFERWKTWFGVLFLVYLCFVSADLVSACPPKCGPEMGPPPIVNPIDDPLTLVLLRQLGEVAEEVEASPSNDVIDVDFPLDPPEESARDPWNDVLQVTRVDNPMVSNECRQKALERALAVTAGNPKIGQHLREEMQKWDEVRQGTRKVHLREYLAHLGKCERACGPYVAGILRCHTEELSQHRPRAVVLFDVGRPWASEGYDFNFSYADRSTLRVFAAEAKQQGKNVMLLSRASILHEREDPLANTAVAERRAEAIRRTLVAEGLQPEGIKTKVLTWEPPRLMASELSELYGFQDQWRDQPNKQFMDQSVVLVAY